MSTLPSILEIGPGRGDFLMHLAREMPEKVIAAIEYKRKRFEKLLKRIQPYPNIVLFLGDAREIVPRLFPEKVLEKVYILFPDPWPKRRHAKHRLFQSSFLHEIGAKLQKGGEVFVATDAPSYLEQIQKVFETNSSFSPIQPKDGVFPTFYATKWEKEGRSLYSLTYRRN